MKRNHWNNFTLYWGKPGFYEIPETTTKLEHFVWVQCLRLLIYPRYIFVHNDHREKKKKKTQKQSLQTDINTTTDVSNNRKQTNKKRNRLNLGEKSGCMGTTTEWTSEASLFYYPPESVDLDCHISRTIFSVFLINTFHFLYKKISTRKVNTKMDPKCTLEKKAKQRNRQNQQKIDKSNDRSIS